MQHEPPFDGKPCPMCPMAFRNLSAVVHNFLLDGNEFDLVQLAVASCEPLMTPEVAQEVRSLHEAASEYVKWRERAVAATSAEAKELARETMVSWLPKLRAASATIEPLTDAHFADRMHSHGQVG